MKTFAEITYMKFGFIRFKRMEFHIFEMPLLVEKERLTHPYGEWLQPTINATKRNNIIKDLNITRGTKDPTNNTIDRTSFRKIWFREYHLNGLLGR